jgi:hypothetical protein
MIVWVRTGLVSPSQTDKKITYIPCMITHTRWGMLSQLCSHQTRPYISINLFPKLAKIQNVTRLYTSTNSFLGKIWRGIISLICLIWVVTSRSITQSASLKCVYLLVLQSSPAAFWLKHAHGRGWQTSSLQTRCIVWCWVLTEEHGREGNDLERPYLGINGAAALRSSHAPLFDLLPLLHLSFLFLSLPSVLLLASTPSPLRLCPWCRVKRMSVDTGESPRKE